MLLLLMSPVLELGGWLRLASVIWLLLSWLTIVIIRGRLVCLFDVDFKENTLTSNTKAT